MKVALLLTGLPRKVQEGYTHYWKNIVENYDTDVYLHFWEDEEYEKVLEVYNPKKFIKEIPFKFTEYRCGVVSPNDDMSRPIEQYDVAGNFRALPMFYSWQTGYNLIEDEYDCIIRSRYDIAGPPINLSKLDLNKINTSNFHWSHSKTHDDNVCITNQENSNKLFSNIFMDIVDYHRKVKYINNPEQNFTDFMIRNDLYKIATKSNEINFLLLRNSKL